ncbi:hypothetical protein [Leekyejoonella antrihumi]|uniref:hypothetical protein n=1 Tax=Leekyejoonella antrihumi TaxID=1660198 RepID=UPI001C9661CD|nr:hypothetical protein [Leekyejoonella antrihumi]
MKVIRESSDDEMVAYYLAGELTSERFGEAIRAELAARHLPEDVLTRPDLGDENGNRARRAVLAATRGYGQDREMFEHFPDDVRWVWAQLMPAELARVRYIEYSYWNELSDGSRLSVDAARRIEKGVRVFGVSNDRFLAAAEAVKRGDRFPPLILAGPHDEDLVCLEGHLRLTAYALAGFPIPLDCLIGSAPALTRWTQ